MEFIAHIENAYETKFGVPRQAGLVQHPMSRIVFEPPYRRCEALRGLEDFSHIWILWDFSGVAKRGTDWSATVRPPRLGGNERIGVFATRSPYRPNPIGLSSVELDHIDTACEDGPVLYVRGADLMNGTPIYDIKPYLPYADAHPDARAGFTDQTPRRTLQVELPEVFRRQIGDDLVLEITEVLAQDPRPAYQNDSDRIYSMSYAGYDVHFSVCEDTVTVTDINRIHH